MPTVHLLDYVAGNVRSLANAIEKLGYTIEWIKEPRDIENAGVRNLHLSLPCSSKLRYMLASRRLIL